MNEQKLPHQCIEFHNRFSRTTKYFSVDRYARRMAFARHLRGPKAISFFEVRWTQGAPRVEELTTDWQETGEGWFRICDWETYNSQMRQMIGLEERTDDWVARCMS